MSTFEHASGADFFTQEHATIYGHGIWHYLICTEIGNIHIVEYKGHGMELHRTLIDADNDKAEKLFRRYCNQMLNGTLL